MITEKMDLTSHEMSKLTFTSYSSREIMDLSVKEVRIAESFDILGHPNEDSFYDSAFGKCFKLFHFIHN